MSMKNRNEDGFTGLEAAIVLIAFVVVAAVFSYVVLGAGFFTTQKSQQVVHAGVTQAASNIVVKGNVYGISEKADEIGYLLFDLGLAAGGLPVDVTKIQMVFSTQNQTPYTVAYNGVAFSGYNTTNIPTAGKWSVVGTSGQTVLIQEGQYFTVKLRPAANLSPREAFNLEIKPENGAALGIERTVPAGITNTTLLF
jgi:archaeal flagellin FlaB